MIKNGGRYASMILGIGAMMWLAGRGIDIIVNPFKDGKDGGEVEYLISDTVGRQTWESLIERKDVVFSLIWFFVTAGPTTTLPADFNTASNTINAIGNGSGGQPGLGGGAGTTGGGSCGGGC